MIQIAITNHARKRLKERCRIKRLCEMKRKAILAWERGTYVPNESNLPITRCMEYDQYRFIFAQEEPLQLITVFPSKKQDNHQSKRSLGECKAGNRVVECIPDENFSILLESVDNPIPLSLTAQAV